MGCGKAPKGNYNIDVRTFRNPQIIDHKYIRFVNVKSIKNFLRGDGEYLPFREGVFDSVYCSHVIEHTVNPSRFLRELIGVTKGSITITCPHKDSEYAKMPYHRHYFDDEWFRKMLEGFNHQIFIIYKQKKTPEQIVCRIWKNS